MNRETVRYFLIRISLLSLLCLPAIALYGQFLHSPQVFDDTIYLNDATIAHFLDKGFRFELRWLAFATFSWTRILLGPDLFWFHLGNLIVHLASGIALFLFLRRLFEIVLADESPADKTLSPFWFAFFGALIFTLHPVSVYAAAYLSQRTILMATLFTLITWRLFLEGLVRKNYYCLVLSAATYLVAVLSKEHAIMAPAVMAALLILKNRPTRQLILMVWPIFVLYGVIAVFVIIQVKSNQVLGSAYEPSASDLISRLPSKIEADNIYFLSMLTQSFLFFKYLGTWLVPSSAWMSVDMYQAFALRLWSWPEIAGLAGFLIYPFIALRLLFVRGSKGLLGFAMLCPWLLFATEFSTIRIQESFVLYRSYLWMPGSFAALPFLCRKLTAKQASCALIFVALLITPLSWLRLRTFSHSLLLWDDAARLIENESEYRPGMERIFYNRGTEFIKLGQYKDALEDLSKAIKLASEKGSLAGYSFYNRGGIYMVNGQYKEALMDYNKAIELGPRNPQPYFGKAQALTRLNDPIASAKAYDLACLLGSTEACEKIDQSKISIK